MPGDHFVILMLLVWSFVDGAIAEQNVKGVLHSRVELNTCYEPRQNAISVEWVKYRNSTSTRLLNKFEKPYVTFMVNSKNILFNVQNMSLTFVNLTKEDEGVYLKRTVLADNKTETCNITLFVQSPPTAVRIVLSTFYCTTEVSLRCEVRGEFLNLSWFRDGLLLADDQRINISERNMTVHVSNLTSSDWGTYTCRVSNEDGTSETHVNISGENTTLCQDSSLAKIISFTGLAVILFLLVSITVICVCKAGFCKRHAPNRRKEPIYDEPNCSEVQESSVNPEESDTQIVNPLPYVYTDFIKQKMQLTEKQQDEEDDYATIPEMQTNMQHLQTPTWANKSAVPSKPC